MKYRDTLELFDELVAAGCPENQARIQAQQLGTMGTYFGDAISMMNAKLDKIDRDLIWMRIVGGAMTLAFLSAWFK